MQAPSESVRGSRRTIAATSATTIVPAAIANTTGNGTNVEIALVVAGGAFEVVEGAEAEAVGAPAIL